MTPGTVGRGRGAVGLDHQSGLPVVDDRANTRILGDDGRQAAGHGLDQDDPERLGRLGGQQEEVGGSQHVR
jgi:hypothetical protein